MEKLTSLECAILNCERMGSRENVRKMPSIFVMTFVDNVDPRAVSWE